MSSVGDDAGHSPARDRYWRGLEQLQETDRFKQYLEREFPEGANELNNPVSRRNFLSIMGASMALAGFAGCRKPVETIVPQVETPETRVQGKPMHYATAMALGTDVLGLLASAREGRPVKIEGNELHTSSRGGTSLIAQGEILNLYDPDRSRNVLEGEARRSWDEFVEAWRERMELHKDSRGADLAVLAPAAASPTMTRLRREFLRAWPGARWVSWSPVAEENRDAGLAAAFGRPARPVHQLEKASVILSLDSDFLMAEEGAVAAARGFSDGRRVMKSDDPMNRLYVVEPAQTVTGGMADHRLRLPARRVGAFLAALVAELERQGLNVPGSGGLGQVDSAGIDAAWIGAVATDLLDHRGSGLLLAGRGQPSSVHALVAALNRALGNVGRTVRYVRYEDAQPSDRYALAELVKQMKQGRIASLVMLGGNPAWDAPADLGFAEAMEQVELKVHLSELRNETSRRSDWQIHAAHFLESWGDLRAADGTLSVVQPLVKPIYGGKSAIELAGLLAGGLDRGGYELVRSTWNEGLLGSGGDAAWRRVLHDGVLQGDRDATERDVDARAIAAHLRSHPLTPGDEGVELLFRRSASLFDGRYANNAWLMELPDPISKMTWDNVALLSAGTAAQVGVESFDEIEIELDGRSIRTAVYIMPGMADGSVALELGYGREGIGRVADGAGVNVYPLRTLEQLGFATGATLTATGRNLADRLSNTQDHWAMEGREIIREGTLDTYRKHPHFAEEMVHVPELQSLWEEIPYDKGNQWGMVIDLNVCNGCNACTIACQSENNVPVVGREQAGYGREMHWLRLDRYFVGDVEDARMVNQPMMCQHCEMAPCEQVCPVNATVHDSEGLNLMTYNRCIGTRYCSNNCPYKVRRFNFFNYTKEMPEIVKMAQNPDVTVRSRGVMEKCTYCLQRINMAKLNARLENRELHDGEARTACEQACPSRAIIFGDINDESSRVAQLKKNDRAYGVLSEFNTRPRTSYLARLHNPNPMLPEPAFDTRYEPHGAGHGKDEGKGGHGDAGHNGNGHG